MPSTRRKMSESERERDRHNVRDEEVEDLRYGRSSNHVDSTSPERERSRVSFMRP